MRHIITVAGLLALFAAVPATAHTTPGTGKASYKHAISSVALR